MSPAAGLPKSVRIRRPGDFKRVFSRGRRLVQAPLAFVYAPSDESTARIGLAVGKKYVHSSVARNHIKRLARESFRLRRHSLPSIDVVLYPVARMNGRGHAQISQSLETLWNRLEKSCAR